MLPNLCGQTMLLLSFPCPTASSSHRSNEKHTWAIGFNILEFLFHPHLIPARMTTIS
jgi:hypothetical protein